MNFPRSEITFTTTKKYVLLVAILSVAFCLTLLLNSQWIYNFVGWIDGWGYFGATYNPIHMRQVYPQHPLGDLLPLLLPNGLFYNFFNPFVANFLIKLIGFVLAGFFMFEILKIEFGYRTAVIGTIAFLSSKQFLYAHGQDYSEGRIILLYLGSLFFIIKSFDANIHEKRSLFFAGLLFSMTVSTGPLALGFTPVLATLYLWQTLIKTQQFEYKQIIQGLFCVLGFFTGILLMCCIHYTYTGHFLYFQNILNKLKQYVVYGRTTEHTINFYLHWLTLPIYTFIGTLFYFFKKSITTKSIVMTLSDKKILFGCLSTLSLITMMYLQLFRNQTAISDHYYFNQTLPITMIAITGIFFSDWLDKLSKPIFTLTSIVFVISTYYIFWSTTNIEHSSASAHSAYLRYIFFFLLFLVLVHYTRLTRVATVGMLSIFLLLNYSPSVTTLLNPNFNISELVPTRQVAHQITVDWIKLMNQLDPLREGNLWYDGYRRGNRWAMLSGASHYWQGRVYNEEFPAIDVPVGTNKIIPSSDLIKHPLIMMSGDRASYKQAVLNLQQANIKATCNDSVAFVSADRKYFDVYVCHCAIIDVRTQKTMQ